MIRQIMVKWRSMKGYSIVTMVGLAAFISLISTTANADNEADQALTLFKAKVGQFERFFAQEPTILYKQIFSHSPTGFLYYHIRINLQKITFDVQRSNSLVSPYIGFIYLSYEREDNQTCGDTVVGGYSTYEKAIENATGCFHPSKYSTIEDVRIAFAFQDGHWVYKDVIRVKYNIVSLPLAAAFGNPVAPGLRVDDNRAWEELVSK